MKKYFLITVLIFLTSCSLNVEETNDVIPKDDNLYQLSTKENLLNNEYFKTTSLYEIEKKGDFGIGTLNGVDGELVVLDGKYYQVKYSGKVESPLKNSLTPFANIKFFNDDKSFDIKNSILENSYNLIKSLNTSDKIAAVKLTGNFNFVKARSVKAVETTDKTLQEIINDQAVFNFDNVKGTMVGFYIPENYNIECFTGFHFHFISENKMLGGHVLDFKIDSVKAIIDFSDSLKLIK